MKVITENPLDVILPITNGMVNRNQILVHTIDIRCFYSIPNCCLDSLSIINISKDNKFYFSGVHISKNGGNFLANCQPNLITWSNNYNVPNSNVLDLIMKKRKGLLRSNNIIYILENKEDALNIITKFGLQHHDFGRILFKFWEK